MINVKFAQRNLKLSEEEKEYIQNKISRKFEKLGVDLSFDIKATLTKNRYVLSLHSKYNKQKIDTTIEAFQIYKGIDMLINKVAQKVKRTHEKKVNINY